MKRKYVHYYTNGAKRSFCTFVEALYNAIYKQKHQIIEIRPPTVKDNATPFGFGHFHSTYVSKVRGKVFIK